MNYSLGSYVILVEQKTDNQVLSFYLLMFSSLLSLFYFWNFRDFILGTFNNFTHSTLKINCKSSYDRWPED